MPVSLHHGGRVGVAGVVEEAGHGGEQTKANSLPVHTHGHATDFADGVVVAVHRAGKVKQKLREEAECRLGCS